MTAVGYRSDLVADGARTPTRRRYVMCPPTWFAVEYAINPWMVVGTRVDRARALAQWDVLRRTYVDLGHAARSAMSAARPQARESKPDALAQALGTVEPDTLSPRDALELLYKLKALAEAKARG